MEWHVLWFLLAGFVLGFAASTLWEWLYFRGVRLRSAGSGSTTKVIGQEPTLPTLHTTTDYRSPAVFLEGEQAQPSYEPLNEGNAPVTPVAPKQEAA